MKILVLTADYPPIRGGIATVALEVCRALRDAGHEISIVAPDFPDQDALDQAEGFPIRRFRGYGLGWARVVPMAIASLGWLRNHDLILAINASHGGVLAMLARSIGGAPYLTFGYAYEFLRFEGVPLFGPLLRRVYNRALAVVAISQFTRDAMERFGVAPARLSVILPGAPPVQDISADHRARVANAYIPDNKRVLLSVGRLIPRKGHETVLRALPSVLERFPDTVWVVVGEGPVKSSLARLANDLGVRERVRFAGNADDDDVAALYEACDVFVLPTGTDEGGHVEGFGLVFVEANAYGKPVVAGRSGGTVDAVLHGETGLLVEPGDAEALATAIATMFDDPVYAQSLGEAGRRRVEIELNWKRFTEQLLALVAERSVS